MSTTTKLVVRYASPLGNPCDLSQGEDFKILKREFTEIQIQCRGGFVRGPGRIYGDIIISPADQYRLAPNSALVRIAKLALHGTNKNLFHSHAQALYRALGPFRNGIYHKYDLDTFYWPRNLVLAMLIDRYGMVNSQVSAYLNFYNDPNTVVFGPRENVPADQGHRLVIPACASLEELTGRYQEAIYTWWPT